MISCVAGVVVVLAGALCAQLTRQLFYLSQDLAATQKGQLGQHTKASESLFGSIRVMESKLSEAKSKKETLKASACALTVQKQGLHNSCFMKSK